MSNQNLPQTTSIAKLATQYSNQTYEWISNSISKGEIKVPDGYDLGNELTTAFYAIALCENKEHRSALDVCSKGNLMSALRDIAIQGLSVSKKQCYPIVYGTELKFMRSYFGTVASFKRIYPQYDITANVLYEGDDYDYCTDEFRDFNYITNVRSKLENRDKRIIAAYGKIVDINTKEVVFGCVMTRKEIDAAWAKTKSGGAVQKEFPQEMAKRTLINRMTKMYLNAPFNASSNYDNNYVQAFNNTGDVYEDEPPINVTPPENEVEKQKIIHSRSKGKQGLESLLATPKPKEEKSTVEVQVEEPVPQETAPEPVVEKEEVPPAIPFGGFEDDGQYYDDDEALFGNEDEEVRF